MRVIIWSTTIVCAVLAGCSEPGLEDPPPDDNLALTDFVCQNDACGADATECLGMAVETDGDSLVGTLENLCDRDIYLSGSHLDYTTSIFRFYMPDGEEIFLLHGHLSCVSPGEGCPPPEAVPLEPGEPFEFNIDAGYLNSLSRCDDGELFASTAQGAEVTVYGSVPAPVFDPSDIEDFAATGSRCNAEQEALLTSQEVQTNESWVVYP